MVEHVFRWDNLEAILDAFDHPKFHKEGCVPMVGYKINSRGETLIDTFEKCSKAVNEKRADILMVACKFTDPIDTVRLEGLLREHR